MKSGGDINRREGWGGGERGYPRTRLNEGAEKTLKAFANLPMAAHRKIKTWSSKLEAGHEVNFLIMEQ